LGTGRCRVDRTETGKDELERLPNFSVYDQEIFGFAKSGRDQYGGGRVAKVRRSKEEIDGDDST
jgi:hypothetical protein